jgi:hypothetical protein
VRQVHQYGDHWIVQYLEADLKTSVGRMYRYPSLDSVRDILDRTNASAEARAKFDAGLEQWGIGACYLDLIDEQYARLKKR